MSHGLTKNCLVSAFCSARLIVGAERRGDSIRECISDNLDFLRLAIKYVLFEVDALEREKETK